MFIEASDRDEAADIALEDFKAEPQPDDIVEDGSAEVVESAHDREPGHRASGMLQRSREDRGMKLIQLTDRARDGQHAHCGSSEMVKDRTRACLRAGESMSDGETG